jgi:hypothetical protein
MRAAHIPNLKLARNIAAAGLRAKILQDRIVELAKGLGADAVIPGKVGVLESMWLSLLYESKVNPAGPGHYSHTWECGDPFHLAS